MDIRIAIQKDGFRYFCLEVMRDETKQEIVTVVPHAPLYHYVHKRKHGKPQSAEANTPFAMVSGQGNIKLDDIKESTLLAGYVYQVRLFSHAFNILRKQADVVLDCDQMDARLKSIRVEVWAVPQNECLSMHGLEPMPESRIYKIAKSNPSIYLYCPPDHN